MERYYEPWRRSLRRRTFLRGASAGVAGAGALALVGCGDDDDDDDGEETPAATEPATQEPGETPAATETAAPTQGEGEPERGGTLRQGTFLSVLGIDPHIEVSIGLVTVGPKVYTYLGGFDTGNQEFIPIASESYEQVSPTEFIFTLRQGIMFHDMPPVNGRELTAEDVVYSFERFRDLPEAQNNDFFKIVTASMEAVDPYTFKITTVAPYADSLEELGDIQKAIVPREAVEAFGDLSSQAIGAGPFMLDEYVLGERTTVRRNPNYFDPELPYLDGTSTQTILDMNTLIQAYRSDQIDINGALLTKLDYDEIAQDDTRVSFTIPALHYGSLAVNASVEPYTDPRVRQALWCGVDRAQFIDKIGLGDGTPMGVLSNGLDFWVVSQEEQQEYIGYDVQKARDLLNAAGYADGFDMQIDTSNGVQLYIDHAEIIVAELQNLNINAELALTDLPTYLSTKLFVGDFITTVFTHNPYESPKIPLGFYHKDGLGGGNWWHYDNPEINAAIEAQAAELDIEARRQLVKDAQLLILQDGGPMINWYSPVGYISYHQRVGGYDPSRRSIQNFLYTEFLRSDV